MGIEADNAPKTDNPVTVQPDNKPESPTNLPAPNASDKDEVLQQEAQRTSADRQAEELADNVTNESPAATPAPTESAAPAAAPVTSAAPAVEAAPAAAPASQQVTETDWENDGTATAGSIAYSYGRGLVRPLISCVYPVENLKNTALIVGGTLAVCAAFPPAAPVVGAVLTAAAIGWGLWSAFKAVSATVTAYNTGNWDNLEKGMEAAGEATLAVLPLAAPRAIAGATSLLSRTEKGAALVSKVSALAPAEGSTLANTFQGMQKGSDFVTGKVVAPIVKAPANVAGSAAGAVDGGIRGAFAGARNGAGGWSIFKKPVPPAATVTETVATSAAAEAAAVTEAADAAADVAALTNSEGIVEAASNIAADAGKASEVAEANLTISA